MPAPGVLDGPFGDGLDGEHVVAVHPDAGEAEAGRTPVQRDARLQGDRLTDRVLVVLAEEDHRCRVGRGEDEGLVDVALAGGAVAEVDDSRAVAGRVVVADQPVALQRHRHADRVQGLGADHERVEVEAVRTRRPVDHRRAAEGAEQVDRVDPPAPGDAVLAVGRDDQVRLPGGTRGADLRSLLAEQRRPQAEFALALQCGRLGVDAPGQHHVAQRGCDVGVRAGVGKGWVLHSPSGLIEKLYEVSGICGLGQRGLLVAGARAVPVTYGYVTIGVKAPPRITRAPGRDAAARPSQVLPALQRRP